MHGGGLSRIRSAEVQKCKVPSAELTSAVRYSAFGVCTAHQAPWAEQGGEVELATGTLTARGHAGGSRQQQTDHGGDRTGCACHQKLPLRSRGTRQARTVYVRGGKPPTADSHARRKPGRGLGRRVG